MSYAATQSQHHVHLPWTAIITLGIATLVAIAVLVVVNQPATESVTTPAAVVPAVAADAAAVPAPESPALRRQLAQEVATRVPQEQQFAYPRNHVAGVTLAPLTEPVVAAHLASEAAPNDPHPLNHFPVAP